MADSEAPPREGGAEERRLREKQPDLRDAHTEWKGYNPSARTHQREDSREQPLTRRTLAAPPPWEESPGREPRDALAFRRRSLLEPAIGAG